MRRINKIILSICTFAFAAAFLAIASPQNAQAADNVELKNPVTLATYGDIRIKGEASYNFTLPGDRILIYEMIVKNTSSGYKYVRFDVDNSVSGNSKITSHLTSVTYHPQPQWMELTPGEENSIQLAIDATNMSTLKDVKNAAISLNIKFEIRDVDDNGMVSDSSDIHNYTLKSKVTSYSLKTIKKNKNSTAKICGYLKTSTGKPIKNTHLMITSGYTSYDVTTNSKGYYSVKVMPYCSSYSGKWNEYAITTRADGYKNKSVIVNPKKNKTIKKNIKLKKQTSKMSYKKIKTVNTQIQAYDLDASKDGSVIATVPFHTMLASSKTDGKRYLVVTNKTGKVLFKKSLPSETPYVDVSEDGKYITVASEYISSRKSNAIIYNKSGKEVYRTPNKMPVLNPYTLKYEKND